jgi:hypothetical protein
MGVWGGRGAPSSVPCAVVPHLHNQEKAALSPTTRDLLPLLGRLQLIADNRHGGHPSSNACKESMRRGRRWGCVLRRGGEGGGSVIRRLADVQRPAFKAGDGTPSSPEPWTPSPTLPHTVHSDCLRRNSIIGGRGAGGLGYQVLMHTHIPTPHTPTHTHTPTHLQRWPGVPLPRTRTE